MSEPERCPLCEGEPTHYKAVGIIFENEARYEWPTKSQWCIRCKIPHDLWPQVARLVESEKMLEWLLAHAHSVGWTNQCRLWTFSGITSGSLTRATVAAAMKESEVKHE
jgi:hypothetical protein